MNNTKNDIAWELLFEQHNILTEVMECGEFIISSIDINKHREARLMTKFDHQSQLPHIFKENKLALLPISRGGYKIGEYEIFKPFETEQKLVVDYVSFPTYLESIDYNNITSESIAINCAIVSNILHKFTGEQDLYSTVNGRMGSSQFNFYVKTTKGESQINVENAQIEIDGGYEGNRALYLIEAKNYISADFLVRQLYYPYRLWASKLCKPICPIFLTYSNGIFHLREYAFEDVNRYNSIRLLKEAQYSILVEQSINIEQINSIIEKIEAVEEPEIPFPQADSFKRIINICEQLKERKFLSKAEITENYDFESRQADYYSNATRYLELAEKCKNSAGVVGIRLSSIGQHIFNLTIEKRQVEFIKQILSHSVFKSAIKRWFELGGEPSTDDLVNIMKNSNLYNIDKYSTTYGRRASTVRAWINWILDQVE